MVWGCFAASGPGRIAVIKGKINSKMYQDILQENSTPSFPPAEAQTRMVDARSQRPKTYK